MNDDSFFDKAIEDTIKKMEDYADKAMKQAEIKRAQTERKLFWIGFIILALSVFAIIFMTEVLMWI